MTATVTAGDVGLDQLLAEAANGRNRFIPGMEAVRAVGSLARRPRTVARRGATLASQLAGVARGTSAKAPARGDRRFSDPAWSQSWLFRRLCQGYLTVADGVRALVDDAALEWAEDQRLRIAVDNIIDALAPTNFPLTNPAVLKTTIDRGGANVVAGVRNAVRDATSPARIPANVDTEPFEVGQTLAVSPGAVVRREPMYELIQYEPRSTEVRETPLLIIPPMISKYYVVDLAPDKSLVEYLTTRGQQTFALSWRNPTRDEAGWNLDDYLAAIIEALETTREIARARSVHVLGLCAGGVASTCAVGHLAETGRLDHVASLSLCVTVLDMRRGGPVLSLSSPEVARVATAKVSRKGYLAGTELSRAFAWLRPNEMIWNNWVNNYYLGNRPPAFDLLYWNQDSMNMPAALHRDLLEIGLENPLPRPGAATILGTPIDLSRITCDAYVVGAETDHLTPWPSCHRTTQLLGGETRFVLSTSGHIAAVINPPGNPRSAYRIGDASATNPDEWLATTTSHQGTWWEDWDRWLAERAGGRKEAPRKLGSRRHAALDPAPGRYVFDSSRG
jgi:polyhydroxyalkanoate synthase